MNKRVLSSFILLCCCITGSIGQDKAEDVLKAASDDISPFAAAWQIHRIIYPDPKIEEMLNNQIANYQSTPGGMSLQNLEYIKALRSKEQDVTEATSITYYSDLRFKGTQQFTSDGITTQIEHYSSGNGITYSRNQQGRAITITNKPKQMVRELALGQPLLILKDIIANMDTCQIASDNGKTLDFSFTVKGDPGKNIKVTCNKIPFRLLHVNTTLVGHQVYDFLAHYNDMNDQLPDQVQTINYANGTWAKKSAETWKLTSFKMLTNSGSAADLEFKIEPGYVINDKTGDHPVSYGSKALLVVPH